MTTQWTVHYEDGTGKRVRKMFDTRDAAEEYAAKATLKAMTKVAPTLSTQMSYREFSARVIEERKSSVRTRVSHPVQCWRGATPDRDSRRP